MRQRHLVAVGLFGAVSALAVARAKAEDVVVLDTEGGLSRVNTATGATSASRAITGTFDSDQIVGIAVRPQTGVLYGVTRTRLYTINDQTGVATPVGPAFAVGRGVGPGLGFHPASDEGRIVVPFSTPGASGIPLGSFSLRIDSATGAAIPYPTPDSFDPHELSYAPSDPGAGAVAFVTSIAYAGNVGGANEWTLLGIDKGRHTLVRIGSAGGLLDPADDVNSVTTAGELTGLPAGATPHALEILRDGTALALVDHPTGSFVTSLYSVDLASGAMTHVSDAARRLTDLAVLPSATLPDAAELQVTKATIRFDFRNGHNHDDTIRVTGGLPFPVGGWAGKTVKVDIGGLIVREFVLDIRGSGKSGPDTFRFGKQRKGEVLFPFVLDIRKARLRERQFVEGTGPASSGPARLSMDVFFAAGAHRTQLDLDFVARGRRGVATLK